MATKTEGKKNFTVREGFIVELETEAKGTGGTVTKSRKTLAGGETVALTYDEYLVHAHKLEYADEKDRKAALEEEDARAKAKVVADPLSALNHLLSAITTHAQATGTLPNLAPATESAE
ncbi:hypothetical protein ACKF11_08890 [Methylobacillus sp. Pita2]|uniref:hypothetical protein n=1 Tax=Methylobacillus sp. Pita2 TaxID=3383245 RepID=UPI0038B4E32B